MIPGPLRVRNSRQLGVLQVGSVGQVQHLAQLVPEAAQILVFLHHTDLQLPLCDGQAHIVAASMFCPDRHDVLFVRHPART